jgi:4-hydroxybenzoate polyprenyltransferase
MKHKATLLFRIKPYLIIMRIDHWLKNVLILPGVVLALKYSELNVGQVAKILCTFIGVSLAASANYTINEFLDRAFDSLHPRKKSRVAVLGKVIRKWVVVQYLLLYSIALSIFAMIGLPSFLICVIFLLNGLCYNLPQIRMKEKKYLDILSESLNSPLRFGLGWYSLAPLSTLPSSAFIAFWLTGVFLMALKRFVELSEFETVAEAKAYRVSLSNYSKDQLLRLAMIGGFSATMLFGVFIMRNHLQFILVLPFIVWIFAEFAVAAINGEKIIYSPETTMQSPKILMILGIAFATACTLYLLNVPIMEVFLGL